MQISIQSLEITLNQVPHRFIVKKILNTANAVTFHCWAPEDNLPAKELIDSEVLSFEWDDERDELHTTASHPVSEQLRQAIQSHFRREIA